MFLRFQKCAFRGVMINFTNLLTRVYRLCNQLSGFNFNNLLALADRSCNQLSDFKFINLLTR